VPGALVDTSVTLNEIDNATVVPHDAVNLGPNSSYVFTISPQMKANIVNVTTLYDDGDVIAVQGRIKPGDKVVTEGQLRLVQGTRVAIKKISVGGSSAQQAPAGAQ
jgi:multidrug efflux system membrane fusion protein